MMMMTVTAMRVTVLVSDEDSNYNGDEGSSVDNGDDDGGDRHCVQMLTG